MTSSFDVNRCSPSHFCKFGNKKKSLGTKSGEHGRFWETTHNTLPLSFVLFPINRCRWFQVHPKKPRPSPCRPISPSSPSTEPIRLQKATTLEIPYNEKLEHRASSARGIPSISYLLLCAVMRIIWCVQSVCQWCHVNNCMCILKKHIKKIFASIQHGNDLFDCMYSKY